MVRIAARKITRPDRRVVDLCCCSTICCVCVFILFFSLLFTNEFYCTANARTQCAHQFNWPFLIIISRSAKWIYVCVCVRASTSYPIWQYKLLFLYYFILDSYPSVSLYIYIHFTRRPLCRTNYTMPHNGSRTGIRAANSNVIMENENNNEMIYPIDM